MRRDDVPANKPPKADPERWRDIGLFGSVRLSRTCARLPTCATIKNVIRPEAAEARVRGQAPDGTTKRTKEQP